MHAILNPLYEFVECALFRIQDMIEELINKKSLRAGKLTSREDREFQVQLKDFLRSVKGIRYGFLAVSNSAVPTPIPGLSSLARGEDNETRRAEALQKLWRMECTIESLIKKLRTAVIAQLPTVNEIVEDLKSALEESNRGYSSSES
jgi:hypothetical protein